MITCPASSLASLLQQVQDGTHFGRPYTVHSLAFLPGCPSLHPCFCFLHPDPQSSPFIHCLCDKNPTSPPGFRGHHTSADLWAGPLPARASQPIVCAAHHSPHSLSLILFIACTTYLNNDTAWTFKSQHSQTKNSNISANSKKINKH